MECADYDQLQLIIGPMFSGKTSELIRRMQRYHLACYRCIIIKYTPDKTLSLNGKVSVQSHDGHSLPAITAAHLNDLEDLIENFDVIGIDEGHLFTDLYEFCHKYSDNHKTVIVAGLDSRSDEIYQQILNLIPLAESVTKLTSICMSCADDAPFTKAITSGGSGKQRYMSVCGHCFEQTHHNYMSPFKDFMSSANS